MRYLLLLALLSACSSLPENNQMPLMSPGDSQAIVEKNTQNKKIYDGFMNIMDVSATMLNADVEKAQADINARIYQWTPEQYQTERSKLDSTRSQKSELFMSFFVPERKHDDLQRNGTKWKVFLDVAGRRYEAKVTRQKMLLAEAQTLFPHHTRWHTAYRLDFGVPMSITEKQEAKLTVTGPVGSLTLDFPPAQ